MNEKIRSLVRKLAETLEFPEPIYEFGALQVEGQGDLINLRPFFPGKEYVGCDMRPGPGVDKVLDLHDIELPDASVGTVISLETLEHVTRPWVASAEIERILKPGGMALITVPMKLPIHAHPNDYWRFTQEGLKVLLEGFPTVVTGQCGRFDHPEMVGAIAWKGENREAAAKGSAILAGWDALEAKSLGRSMKSHFRDFIPVGLINLYRASQGEHRI